MALSLPGSGPLVLPDLTTGYPMLGGMFRNLKLNANGTTAVVNVTADALVLESVSAPYTYLTVRSIVLTASIAVSLVGGMDVGTSTASTWYSVWVISNGTATNTLLSLSATAPTMPTGYTHRARVGWIRTDATANKFPLGFIQNGSSVAYKIAAATNLTALPTIASGVQGSITTPTWVSFSTTSVVPSTASFIKLHPQHTVNVSCTVMAAPNPTYVSHQSNTPGLRAPCLTGVLSGSGICFETLVQLETQSIYVAADNASCSISAAGWEDNL